MPASHPQLTDSGELLHLLTIDGLSRDMIHRILDTAENFVGVSDRDVKKVPLLRGKSVFNLFFENSTRTRTTFEIAANRLSADSVNLHINTSSASKGESLLDTVDNLAAMHADIFVVRQLDMYTIRHFKKDFTKLRVAVVGDVLHSRVARSDILALSALGVPEIRVIAPKTLLPSSLDQLGVHPYSDMREGLKDVDVVIMLRLQNERMRGALLPSAQEYFRQFGLTSEKLKLAKPDAIVMHPGPMNRGVEIESAVADSGQAVILNQVTFGIAVRMAVMSMLAAN